MDLTIGVSKPHHLIRLGLGARADLLAWSSFLSKFNGYSMFLDPLCMNSSDVELFTDAAMSIGYDAFFNGKWLQGR